MSTAPWRFLTLLLAALGLATGAAHALELPMKLQLDAVTYMLISRSLYRYFGIVGGAIQLTALITAIVLALQVRGRASFRPTLWGALLLALSLALWGGLVLPVNLTWGRTLDDPDLVAASRAYVELRSRWEFGHLAAFAAWAVGYAFLVRSVLVEVPSDGTDRSDAED